MIPYEISHLIERRKWRNLPGKGKLNSEREITTGVWGNNAKEQSITIQIQVSKVRSEGNESLAQLAFLVRWILPGIKATRNT